MRLCEGTQLSSATERGGGRERKEGGGDWLRVEWRDAVKGRNRKINSGSQAEEDQASPRTARHGTPTELQAHTQLGTHGLPEVLEWVPALQSELWKCQMCHQSQCRHGSSSLHSDFEQRIFININDAEDNRECGRQPRGVPLLLSLPPVARCELRGVPPRPSGGRRALLGIQTA
ncbi:hypothetical protein AOLI_G00066290 [Acnodon oligacanthus]